MKELLFLLNIALFLPQAGGCQSRYDVVIDEIMADPSPQVGLPNNEWIELKNTSALPVNLSGWRIGDATGQSGPMAAFTLLPDSFIVICSSSALSALSPYGTAMAVTGFPSLDNTGDLIYLKSAADNIIDAVDYSDRWYLNPIKTVGGWSLEMIDPENPCTGGINWTASTDSKGGTPGRRNSVDNMINDDTGPSLTNAYLSADTVIIIEFSKPVDSTSALILNNFSITPGLTILSVALIPPVFNKIRLLVSPSLNTGQVYEITVRNITDCKGNRIEETKTRTGIPEPAAASDLIINEILFNPKSGGSDYVEFYNRGQKIIDANKLYIANRNSNNSIGSQKLISDEPRYIYPGQYIVLTEDKDRLALDYFVKDPQAVITVSSLPSFPDDQGTIVLLNIQGNIVDELQYSEDWHFKLISNPEAVALERIDPETLTQNPGNWHSAASTSGYGTPGYKNSQYRRTEIIDATITVTPQVFSPDNDGYNDIAAIQYKMTETGYVATVTIFDAAGRPVKDIVQNAILGLEGYWNWDGLDNKGLKLPIGTYIVYTKIFTLNGVSVNFKNALVLARRLR